jgi:hypothetical protein
MNQQNSVELWELAAFNCLTERIKEITVIAIQQITPNEAKFYGVEAH